MHRKRYAFLLGACGEQPNFANKVWNASRFIMMNIEKASDLSGVTEDQLTLADKWILSKVNTLSKDVTENLDKYELGIALQKVYDVYLGRVLRLVH